MIPYGIVIKQNRLVLQQSLIVWQKKFGLLKLSKFIGSAIPLLSVFAVILCVVTVIFQESFNIITLISGILLNVFFIGFLMYLTAFKTVKEYAATAKSEKIQLVLNEETLEITTEFSKEVVPYNEIDFCYEKDFLLTIIRPAAAAADRRRYKRVPEIRCPAARWNRRHRSANGCGRSTSRPLLRQS